MEITTQAELKQAILGKTVKVSYKVGDAVDMVIQTTKADAVTIFKTAKRYGYIVEVEDAYDGAYLMVFNG